MTNYVIIYTLFIIACKSLAETSTETIKNEVFCRDFFDPIVRKQLLKMNLVDLPTYVDMKNKTLFEYDIFKEVAIFEKNKLVVIEEPRTFGYSKNAGRSMFLFLDFINEAEGTNCLTNLILPYVFVMCDQATYLFTLRKSDGGMDKKKYEVSLPGLNLIDDPATQTGLKRKMRIIQHIPDVGVIFVEKTVDFESEEDVKKLGITKEQLSDLPQAQKSLDFRYLTIISENKASLTSEPTQEGAEQWKLGPPMAHIDGPEMYIINLNSPEKPQYKVELKGDVWQLDKVENKYLEEDFCYFSLDDIPYESDREFVETPKPEEAGISENPKEVTPDNPTELTSGNPSEKTSSGFFLILPIILLFVAVVIAGSLYAFLKRKSPKIIEKTKKKKKPEVKKKAPMVLKKVVLPKITPSAKGTSGVSRHVKDGFGRGKIRGLLDTSAENSSTAASTLSRNSGSSNPAVSGSVKGSNAPGTSIASSTVISTMKVSNTFAPGNSAVPGSQAPEFGVHSFAPNSTVPNPGVSVALSTALNSRAPNPGSSSFNSTAPKPGSSVDKSTM